MLVLAKHAIQHDGVDYNDGDVLEVTEEQAEALMRVGAAVDAPAEAVPARARKRKPT